MTLHAFIQRILTADSGRERPAHIRTLSEARWKAMLAWYDGRIASGLTWQEIYDYSTQWSYDDED